jgi:hypothetical protein
MKKLISFIIFFLSATYCESSVREAMEATCYIKTEIKSIEDGKEVIKYSCGTGTVFKVDDKKVYILTCGHVAGGDRKLYARFYGTGKQSHSMKIEVIFSINKPHSRRWDGRDIGIGTIDKKFFKGYPIPKPIPIAPKSLVVNANQRVISCGCPAGNWPSAWIGHVKRYRTYAIDFIPEPIPGRSGSAIFDEKGEKIIGIIIEYNNNPSFGVAVSLISIYKYTDNLKMVPKR